MTRRASRIAHRASRSTQYAARSTRRAPRGGLRARSAPLAAPVRRFAQTSLCFGRERGRRPARHARRRPRMTQDASRIGRAAPASGKRRPRRAAGVA
ncbi:conserved hypothetical protein [Burkholderia pseudomallei 668]|nr:conserved hypothetical protein [Burkholderia pseudomallei 668]